MYERFWQTLCETRIVAQSNRNRNLRSGEPDPEKMRGIVASAYMTGLTLPVRLSPSADIYQPELRAFHKHFGGVPHPIASKIVLV